jgi:hypothetical protein
MTMYAHDTRRHPDGSIDFEFYRRRATRLRRQTRRALYKRARLPVGWQNVFCNALLGAAVMAAVAFAIGTPVGQHTPDASLSGERSAPSGRG